MYEIKNSELHNRIKIYVKFALILTKQELEKDKYPDNYPNSSTISFRFIESKLKDSLEYQECIQILKTDEIISNHFDKLLGIHDRRSRSLLPENLMIDLPQMGVYKNVCEFNEEVFNREYVEFEKVFYEDHLTYEVLAPLSGIAIKQPIELTQNLQICCVNQSDLSLLLENESINEKHLFQRSFWAIKTNYKLPKILGDNAEIDLEKAKKNNICRENANDNIQKVLMCLRLFGLANVYPIFIIHRTKPWIFTDVKQYPVSCYPEEKFEVDYGSFEEDFVNFWKTFNSDTVSKFKFISIASKRFSYAHERKAWEDKIIDLLIAAEAIFLSGSEGELSFQLALRASLLLGKDFQTRKTVFEDMKLAYKLRSKIVHGSMVESVIKQIKKNQASNYGEEYKMNEFIFKIQEYIRLAICRMIQESDKPLKNKDLIDWEKLIFE